MCMQGFLLLYQHIHKKCIFLLINNKETLVLVYSLYLYFIGMKYYHSLVVILFHSTINYVNITLLL